MKKWVLPLAILLAVVFTSCGSSPIKGEWGFEDDNGLIGEAFLFENGKYTQSTFALFGYFTVRGTYTEASEKIEFSPTEYFDYNENKWDSVENSGLEPTKSISYTVIDKNTLSLVGTEWGKDEAREYKRGSYFSRIEKLVKGEN